MVGRPRPSRRSARSAPDPRGTGPHADPARGLPDRVAADRGDSAGPRNAPGRDPDASTQTRAASARPPGKFSDTRRKLASAIARPARSASARRTRAADLAVVAALLLAASATWGPVFGDAQGYIAGIGGVLLGLGIAALGVRLRLTPWLTAVLGVVGYLGFGGLIALRQTANGILPSAETFQMLMVQSIEGWKDLLTLTPPAGAFIGPTVLPYLVCLTAALFGGSIVLRTRRPEWAMLSVFAVLVSGILFGSQHAPLARWIGVFIGTVGLAWWARVVERRRVVRAGSAGGESGAAAARRRRNGAIALVASGALVATVLAPFMTNADARYAIRNDVVPPLDLREYPSPLTDFRSYIDQREKEALMTVEGLADKGRIRLATLDAYDGLVYNVSNRTDRGFRRVGPEVTDRAPADGTGTETLELRMKGYSGVWVPGSGELRRVDFAGRRADELRSSLYYSPGEETALTVTPLARGDAYSTTVVTHPKLTDKQLEGRAFGAVAMETNTNVPVAAQAKAREIVQGKTSPIQQARALEAYLKTKGFYADGKDGTPSRPGHRNQRIQSLLESDYMQGDDEQYAVAMALMARSLGMPARVVMGFYPETHRDGAQVIKGRDAHVWVEVNFDGAGWVTFDPTPPRDQRLTTQVPKPKPNPRPQVVQPPEPPDDPVELPPIAAEDRKKKVAQSQDASPWVRYVLLGSGSILVLLLPFALILALKALRTRRRRNRGSPDSRAAGAWEDVLDVARDGKITVDPRSTRSEQARVLAEEVAAREEAAHAGAISRTAELADSFVFSGVDIAQTMLDAAWGSAEEAKTAIRKASTRRSRFSLRSFKFSLRSFGGLRWHRLRRGRIGQ